MKRKMLCRSKQLGSPLTGFAIFLFILTASQQPYQAQQTVGAIAGTVLDASGAAVQNATVKARNVATNFEVTVNSNSSGSYSISNLPIGTYELKFTKRVSRPRPTPRFW